MPMNRVQFQPGLSMFEFLQRYGTQEKCEAAVEATRWPSGFRCPRCQGWALTLHVLTVPRPETARGPKCAE